MSSKKGFFYTITALHPEVTGSCLLVTVHYPDGNTMMFIVDCGLFQEKPYTQLNSQVLPFTSSKIQFALITHNHADHNGRGWMSIVGAENFKKFSASAFFRVLKNNTLNNWKYVILSMFNKPIDIIGKICILSYI